MTIEQVVNVVHIAIHKLPHMESLYKQIKYEVNKLQYTRQGLVNDIEARKNKISLLDKIAFSIEQGCKMKGQEVEVLTAQKDRLEKLIANVLNGEGYSKLKEIIKVLNPFYPKIKSNISSFYSTTPNFNIRFQND